KGAAPARMLIARTGISGTSQQRRYARRGGQLREGTMNRRNILGVSVMALLGLAFVVGDVFAQQKTLKEQLVGAWTLVSEEITPSTGVKRQDFGANPKGILILDAGGR